MAQAKFRGRFLWQELMTEDPAAAAVFYSKLLGWQAKDSGGDPAYTEFHVGGRGVAGMMKMPAAATQMGAKPMWMPYIGVENVDDAVEDIEELGGKVHRPASDIPNVGRFAVLTDPQGAAFAVFKPSGEGMPAGSSGVPQAGEFSWMELATTDLDEAFEFYSKVFGWQALHRHDMGPGGVYLIFGSEGVQRGGMFRAGPERGPTPNWLPYASVADADMSAKEIPGFGGRVLAGPMDVPDGGRIVHLSDPGGVLFAIHAQVTAKKDAIAKPAAAPKAAAAPKPAPKPAAPPAAPKPAPSPAAPKPAEPKPQAVAKPVPKPAVVAGDGLPVMAPDASPPAPPAAKKSLKPAAKPAAKETSKAATKPAVKQAVAKAAAKKAKKKTTTKKKAAAKKKKRGAKKAVARKSPAKRSAAPARAVARRADKAARKTDKKKDKKKNKKKKDKKHKKDQRKKGKKDKARRKK